MTIDNRCEREGFSLVEMIIAIAVAAIVMSAVLLLITYSSDSMNRTSSAVNVQNQAKDAVMHVTTYLQEGSDACEDATKTGIMVINEKKNQDGDVVSADIAYYWYDASDNAIYFNKMDYASASKREASPGVPVSPSAVTPSAGSPILPLRNADGIDFSDVDIDKIKVKGNDKVFVKNCVGFSCKSDSGVLFKPDPTNTPAPGAPTPDPAATPDPNASGEKIRVGGKQFIVEIALKNDYGNAEFTCDKTVFLRNQ